MYDKKQKSCVKRIHFVDDDGLYDRKAFHKVKIVFQSSSVNDGEFINYSQLRFPKYLIEYQNVKVDIETKIEK